MDLETMRRQHGEKTKLLRAIMTVAQEEKREFTPEEERKFMDLTGELAQQKTWIDRESIVEQAEEAAGRSFREPIRPGLGDEEREQSFGQAKRFRSLGEQLQAVHRAAIDPRHVDLRLNFRAGTGVNESTLSDGGALVQTDFAAELYQLVHDTGMVVSRCRSIPISGNANGTKINGVDEVSRANGSRWGGIRAYWASEGATLTSLASRPRFRQINLELEKLIGLVYATDENLQDAAQLETIIRTGFTEEFGFKLDDAVVNGDGSGKPLGILASPALVSVAKETGQPAKTLQPENIVNMWSRCWARSRLNAVWFINQDVEPQLYTMAIAVGMGGGTVYMPPGGLSQQPYGTLFGRPVIAIEQCATLGSKGDIILADMSQYALAEKGGMQSAMSIHVSFLTDESVFRFVMRVDGEPFWHSALTPFTGSANTLSPFVTLDARA